MNNFAKNEIYIRFHGLFLRKVKELQGGGLGDILLVEEVLNKTRFVIKSHRIDDYIDNEKFEFISYNDFVNNPEFKEFISEIIAYINLIHPNIVDFYGFDIVRGIPRILLLYVDGGNLHEWIHQKKLSSFKTIIEILIQIATALKYSHEHGLHRDLKPSNILMEKYNSNNQFIVKIADFGLVKLLKNKHLSSYNIQERKDKNFLTEKYVGTCGYASPEQVSLIHGKIIDENTDILSFGQVACEMIYDGKNLKFINVIIYIQLMDV